MSNDPDLISLKELASKLKVSDALLKKLIKDFGIETDRTDKRVCLTEESVQTVREILALRASGKKNQEIKEMFDASIAENKNSEQATSVETKNTNEITEPKADPAESISEPNPDQEEIKKEPNQGRFKKNKKKHSPKEEKTSDTKITEESSKAEDSLDISGFLNDVEDSGSSSNIFAENEENEEPEEKIELEEPDLEDDDDDHHQDKKTPQGKIRRRSFSFRYIQKQIMNDTKRVNYIKSKLKRGRISETEKMLLTDSLEHRSSLLNGWQHMLRWVKS